MIRKKSKQPSTHKNHKRDFKGIWIPVALWYDTILTLHEKLFYIEIDSLDCEDGCFASNKHFSNMFGVTTQRCSQIINSIEKKGYISITLFRKKRQVIKRVIRVSNIFDRGIKYIKGGYQINVKGSNTNKSNTKKSKPKKPLQTTTPSLKTFKKYLPKVFLKNKTLLPNIKEYIAHRKELKKPLTERAIKVICTKCKNFNTQEVQTAFETACINGNVGIFPKKEYEYSKKKKDLHAPNAVRKPKGKKYREYDEIVE